MAPKSSKGLSPTKPSRPSTPRSPARYRDRRSASPEGSDRESNYRARGSPLKRRVDYREASDYSSEEGFDPPPQSSHRSAREGNPGLDITFPGLTKIDNEIDIDNEVEEQEQEQEQVTPKQSHSPSSLFVPENGSDSDSESDYFTDNSESSKTARPTPPIIPRTPSPKKSAMAKRAASASAMPPPSASPMKRSRPGPSKSPLDTVLGTTMRKTPGPRKRVEDDPENIEIMRLRREEGLGWLAIANHLNTQRALRGEKPNFTEPAVYSRFVRNSPRIAIANGELGFDPKDYMHLRHPHYYPNQRAETGGLAMPGGMRKRGALAVQASSLMDETMRNTVVNANLGVGDGDGEGGDQIIPKDIKHNYRSRMGRVDDEGVLQECEELQSRERTAMLVAAAGRVERNFWRVVADELEKECGTLYNAKVVEAVYRAAVK